jgi:activator of 2-hydroxyglutaryl-CoA dehydratase
MINLQQRGYGLNAIAAGLLDAVCENYLKDLGPGIQLRAPYIFCGGVSEIEAIRNNFEQKLQAPIHVPEYNKITAAYGAALLAKHYYLSNTSQTSPPKQLTMPRGKAPKVSLQCGRSDCLNCGKCTPSNQ